MLRVLALVATVVIGAALALAIQIWAKPFLLTAVILQWPASKPAAAHDLPSSYLMRHKGHVEVATGLYIREDDDLALRHTPPFVLTRTYLSGDRISRQFGVGATNSAEWYLIGDPSTFTSSELILADGRRVHFDRTSRGTSYQNALYVHRGRMLDFHDARLGWSGSRWLLRRQDGSLATFLPCGPGAADSCSVVEMRDADSHVLEFQRDRTSTLQAIQAPSERINFRYDDRRRITQASVDGGDRVEYAYDERGRLVRVSESGGTVRLYTYSDKDELLTIREPGSLIENTFDNTGRVTRQTTLMTGEDGRERGLYLIELAYTVSNEAVMETSIKESDGARTQYRFNSDHNVTVEIHEAEGLDPVTIVHEREPVGGFTTAFTVRCTARGRHVTRSVRLYGDEEETKRDLAQRTCGSTARRGGS